MRFNSKAIKYFPNILPLFLHPLNLNRLVKQKKKYFREVKLIGNPNCDAEYMNCLC